VLPTVATPTITPFPRIVWGPDMLMYK
jgi:hypothetical protein